MSACDAYTKRFEFHNAAVLDVYVTAQWRDTLMQCARGCQTIVSLLELTGSLFWVEGDHRLCYFSRQ